MLHGQVGAVRTSPPAWPTSSQEYGISCEERRVPGSNTCWGPNVYTAKRKPRNQNELVQGYQLFPSTLRVLSSSWHGLCMMEMETNPKSWEAPGIPGWPCLASALENHLQPGLAIEAEVIHGHHSPFLESPLSFCGVKTQGLVYNRELVVNSGADKI